MNRQVVLLLDGPERGCPSVMSDNGVRLRQYLTQTRYVLVVEGRGDDELEGVWETRPPSHILHELGHRDLDIGCVVGDDVHRLLKDDAEFTKNSRCVLCEHLGSVAPWGVLDCQTLVDNVELLVDVV